MSTNVSKPNFPELDNRTTLASSADLRGTLFQIRFDQLAIAAEVIGDFVAVTIAMISAYSTYHVLELGKGIVYPVPMVVQVALALALLFVIMLDREGLYRRGSGMLRINETAQTLRVSVLTFLLLFSVTIFDAHLLSRWVLGVAFLLTPIMVVIEKQVLFSIVRSLHMRGRGVQQVIIYGSGFTGKRVFSALLRSRKLGINPLVFVDDDEEQVGKRIYALGYHHKQFAPVIHGPVTSHLIESYSANMIVVAMPSLEQEKLAALAAVAKEARVMLAFVPSGTIYEDARVNYIDIDGIMLATVDDRKNMYLYERTKRLIDLLVSVMGLVILSPLFAALALAVRMDSKSSVIFKQQRVGKGGRLFEIYKFRTMRVDAPKYQFSPTTADDQRITRLGRILRKLSLDELPQILNVIKGEMSLVGPARKCHSLLRRMDHESGSGCPLYQASPDCGS